MFRNKDCLNSAHQIFFCGEKPLNIHSLQCTLVEFLFIHSIDEESPPPHSLHFTGSSHVIRQEPAAARPPLCAVRLSPTGPPPLLLHPLRTLALSATPKSRRTPLSPVVRAARLHGLPVTTHQSSVCCCALHRCRCRGASLCRVRSSTVRDASTRRESPVRGSKSGAAAPLEETVIWQ